MTDSLAIPLTALLACTKLYSSTELAAVKDFTLHLVGAAQHEYQHVRLLLRLHRLIYG